MKYKDINMINLSILKMTQSRKQGIKATKNVDISTGATVEIKLSVGHPSQICSTYLEEGKCEVKTCASRHPKMCKWMRAATGCRSENCDYLQVHVTLASDDGQQNIAHKSFSCACCKSCFDDIACVVQHDVNSGGFNLCLNCESWIQHKDKVLTPGWTILDQNGYPRRDV